MERKGIIYKATDRILNKSYIGQTKNRFENRKQQHLKCAKERFNKDYYNVFYKMIRFIGEENFDWEILEDNIDEDNLNEREIYYINKYDSYNNGYNSNPGGQMTHTSILNENHIKEIINLLLNSEISMKEIGSKYNVKPDVISDINCGETWFNCNLEYPIRKMGFNSRIGFNEEQILEIHSLLKDNKISIKEISKKFNCHPISISKINTGDAYKIKDVVYPIREVRKRISDETILKIIDLLLNSSKSQSSIAKLCDVERKVVNTINTGKYHSKRIKLLNNTIEFPIRK